MKSLINLALLSLITVPMVLTAQEYPAGTKPNEHNINGAEWPRVGADRRVHFRINAPDAKKVEVQFRGEMTKGADGYWTLVSTQPEVVGFHYYQIIVDGVSSADHNSHI